MADSPAMRAVLDYNMSTRPKGRSEKGQKWYPDSVERASCCDSVRSPSHAYPWSLYKHCFSRKHKRQLLLEQPSELEIKALAMTMDTALLFVNETGLLLHVAKKLLGE